MLPFLPDRVKDSGWAIAIRAALFGLLLLVPALIVVRETQRASVRGSAVQLSSCPAVPEPVSRPVPDRRGLRAQARTAAAAGDLPGQRQRGVERVRLLGPALSRLREYSCDRHGAYLSPLGATGLVLLASGRYTQTDVDLDELVRQGRKLRGFWVGLAQLPRSHPFTVRRLECLYRIGLFHADVQSAKTRV